VNKGASERRRGIGELRRHALLFGRVAWVAVALVALGIFVVSIFGYWTEVQRVCLEGARACSDKGLLTQENMRQLERLGLSVRMYSDAPIFNVGPLTFLDMQLENPVLLAEMPQPSAPVRGRSPEQCSVSSTA
jgi:hypothetical protein